MKEKGYSVKSQVNHHIVPFGYTEKYEEVSKLLLNDKDNWVCEKIVPQGERILHHVSNFIHDTCEDIKDSQHTGLRFVLKNGFREKYDFYNLDKIIYGIKGSRDIKINFHIKSVELYLFKTQVGLIVFDIYFPEADMETLINGNYFLKQFHMESTSRTYMTYKRKSGRDEYDEGEFRIKSLIDKITKELCVNTYFEDGPAKKDTDNNRIIYYPNNALVYNGVLVDGIMDETTDDMNLNKYLFRMRRSFKKSYKPSKLEYDLKNNPEIIQLFENSYWGVSLEGLTNIVYNVDDNETNNFFEKTYFPGKDLKNNGCKLKNIYFYIYLLGLHQRYALLNFAIKASRISENLNNREIIDDLKRDIAFFSLKSTFKDVVNITHQTKLYDMIRHSLRIDELMDELHYEVDALLTVTKLMDEKKEKIINDKKEKATMVLSVIGATAVSSDLSELIERILEEQNIMINLPISTIIFSSLILLGLGIGYWLNNNPVRE